MKKLLTCCIIVLAFACNSGDNNNDTGTETGSASDSLKSRDEGAINNDIPMRTLDTSTNMMMDTTNPRDTVTRP